MKMDYCMGDSYRVPTAKWKSRFVKPRRMRVVAFGAIALLIGGVLLSWMTRQSVLPSDSDMLKMSEAELRQLVVKHIPLGTSRARTEEILTQQFRKQYRTIGYDGLELMKQMFPGSVVVDDGDYYISSKLASKMFLIGSDVVTADMLFSKDSRLKEVAVQKWRDSL